MKTISGPKLQTFYTCKDALHICEYLDEIYDPYGTLIVVRCAKISELPVYIDGPSFNDIAQIKTPIDCPLLGKTIEEEDVRLNKDVLMRNL